MNVTPENSQDPEGSPLARIAAWHLIWTIVVLVGFAGVNAAAGGLTIALLVALGAGLAPGLMVLVMPAIDGRGARVGLLVLWAVCGAAAASFTGGMGGPMSVWCLAPLAVAGAVGQKSSAALAGALSFLSVLTVVILQISGYAPAAPSGLTGFALGLTAVTAIALGVIQGIVSRRSSPAATVAVPDAPADEAAPVLTTLPGDVLIVDPNGVIAAASGRGSGIKVRTGEALASLARTSDRQLVIDALTAARLGERQTVEFTPDEIPSRHMTLDLAPGADGRLVGLLRDTTAAHVREQGLELARADAENLAAGRARFLAGMSHELRTPLNAIMGFSDIMKNRMFGELSVKYGEYAELIHESGSHLLDLINDVLDISKIEAHRYELHKEFMDAREPVSAALRILRVQADSAGVKLRATLPSDPLEVDADRRAIKQIVINLVSNALKFTPRDGSVIVGLAGRGADLDLTVADTGIGISPDDLQRIGKPYEQVGDAARKTAGTGLGLSLVRAFAELHGGQMVIESRLGEGTAVTVSIPVVVDAAALPAPGNVVAFKPQR